MTRKELILSKEWHLTEMQLKLFNSFENYITEGAINKPEICKNLGITKGHYNQIMRMAYDPRISKLVEMALAMNKVPVLFFVDANEYVDTDEKDMKFILTTNNIKS